jgi:hypothetical protein
MLQSVYLRWVRLVEMFSASAVSADTQWRSTMSVTTPCTACPASAQSLLLTRRCPYAHMLTCAPGGVPRRAAAKIDAKFDPKMESEARAWIAAVLGESLGDGSMHDVLQNGIALCNVVRKIQPDILPPPSKASMPFKQMENIGNYLSACTNLGMSAHDSFQTVDLFEGKNMVAVATQIHRLGSIAASRGFDGPSLGVKTANKNVREFTEEQVRHRP